MKLNILCIVALVVISGATEIKVTPVQKVLQLMGGMLEKGKAAKKAEQVENAKSVGFCVDTISVKSLAIGDATDTIAELTSTIDKATADINKLATGIAKLLRDESTFSGDIKAADDVRKTQKADFETTLADYKESIVAIGRAITVMMGQAGDKAQKAASFVQVSSLNNMNLMPESAKKAINLFLQQGSDDNDNVLLQDLANAAPEAHGYESQSSGVIDMLKGLQSKFVAEQSALEMVEKNQVSSFNMLRQDLKLQLDNAAKVRGQKDVSKITRTSTRTEKTKDRTDATKIMNEDQAYLSKVKADCSAEKATFEERQGLRTGEITALQKAVEVIGSGAVSGSANKHLPKLLQQGQQATSLAGLRSNLNAGLEQQQKQMQRGVAQFLQTQASKMDSRILSAVALRVAADPMKKVKKMITDMITKLSEQAASEATKKGQCDSDMAANKKTRIAKTQASDTLTAEIERLASKITKTGNTIKSLTDAVAALDSAQKQKTTIRETNTVNNKATVEDAAGAQKAVAQALEVLQTFYSKSGDAAAAASFLQISAEPIQSGESQGVLGLLEVIQSDFARLEAETTATENSEKKKYVDFVEDTKVDKISKTAEIEHKGDVKLKATEDKQVAEGDLKDEQTALTDALTTFDKLKKACIAVPMSYEERTARRNKEIANLKEALTMLEAENTEDQLRAGDTQANLPAL